MTSSAPIEKTPLLNGDASPHPAAEGSSTEKQHVAGAGIGGAIWSIIGTVFLQSLGFTIIMPSIWFYLQSLGGTESFLGWVVAAYSIGGFISSPLFGWWSNVRGAREPLAASLALSVLGNFWYALASVPYFLQYASWQLFFARFIVGFASGAFSVCRAYVSHATTVQERRSVIAKISASQGIGFVLGPAIGTVISFVHFNWVIWPKRKYEIDIDQYTAVGWISGLLSLINIVWLYVSFKPIHEVHHADAPSSTNDTGATEQPRVWDWAEILPFGICCWCFMIIVATFSVFETMLTIYTSGYYNWHVTQNGILLAVCGVVSIGVFVVTGIPATIRWLGDRSMLIGGFSCLGISCLLLAQWPHIETNVPKASFMIGAALQAIGYPIASAALNSLSTKVIHPKSQGSKMGILNSLGYLARMIGPVAASDVAWRFGGALLLFFGMFGILLITISAIVIFYKRLVPHPAVYAQMAANDANQNNNNNNSTAQKV